VRRGGGIGGPSRTGYRAAPREKGMCSSWSAAVDGEDVGIEDIAGVLLELVRLENKERRGTISRSWE